MVVISWYFKLFQFIAVNRLKANDVDPRRIHTHTVTVLSTGLLMWAYAFLAFLTIESPVPGIVGFVCATVHLFSPFLFRISANAYLISNIMLTSGMVHQGTFSFYSGGFRSHILIWFGILPMLAGIIAGKKGAVLWAVLTILWSGTYLAMDIMGFQFPAWISPTGKLLAHAFLVFGWIFLSSLIIYVLLVLNEQREKILDAQTQKIDDLFRVLFHDLAGPLSRVSIGLNIAHRENDPDRKEHGLTIASKATESMMEITQNVRRMYAVTKGKVSNDMSFTPLNEAVDYISKVYSVDLERKNLKLEYDFRDYHGLKLFVEPVSFKNQVLGNALSNAIKFSPANSKITIKAYPFNHDYYVVEVADQGVGMPPEIRDSLFDINKKTSRMGTNGEVGTGFGMHIMKSFIEMYQGKIQVESFDDSHPNPGTVIKLILKAEWT